MMLVNMKFEHETFRFVMIRDIFPYILQSKVDHLSDLYALHLNCPLIVRSLAMYLKVHQ